MWLNTLLRSGPKRRPRSAAKPSGFRPGLEALEERRLLSNGIVNAGPIMSGPRHLAFTQQPNTATAGQTLTLQVAVENQQGQVITTDNTDQVTLHLAGKPDDFAKGSMLTATVKNGVATFSNVVLDKAGHYILKATAEHAGTGFSQVVSITPAAASQLVFLKNPGTTLVNHSFSAFVAVEDKFGNILTTDSTDTVALKIATGPTGGTLAGTTSLTVHHGIAVFSGLSLTVAGTYTLNASATGLSTAPSSSFHILSSAPATHLAKALKVSVGAPQHDPVSGLDLVVVTLTNTSATALKGPLDLVLNPLKDGVTLTNKTGTIHGRPYVVAVAAGGTLGAGKSVTVTLKFSNPNKDPLPVHVQVREGI